MKLWDRLRERRAAKRQERERQAQEDLVAISRGEAHELSSYKRAIRRDYVGGLSLRRCRLHAAARRRADSRSRQKGPLARQLPVSR